MRLGHFWTAAGLAICLSGAAHAKPITDADLAPIRLGKNDTLARELILRQEWAAAAKAVDGVSAGASLVRGWLLEQANQHDAALAALRGVESALPLLADLVHLTRGRALMGLERYPDAAKALALVQSDDAIGWAARRRMPWRCARPSSTTPPRRRIRC